MKPQAGFTDGNVLSGRSLQFIHMNMNMLALDCYTRCRLFFWNKGGESLALKLLPENEYQALLLASISCSATHSQPENLKSQLKSRRIVLELNYGNQLSLNFTLEYTIACGGLHERFSCVRFALDTSSVGDRLAQQQYMEESQAWRWNCSSNRAWQHHGSDCYQYQLPHRGPDIQDEIQHRFDLASGSRSAIAET
jgi:hypothetical protein